MYIMTLPIAENNKPAKQVAAALLVILKFETPGTALDPDASGMQRLPPLSIGHTVYNPGLSRCPFPSASL
jgi:hypothetical protein